MRIPIRGYGESQIDCEADQIVVRLPRKVFGKEWGSLVVRLTKAIGHQRLIFNPQRVMTERGEGEDAPRWRGLCIDALTWMLFLLKVPVDHELVALWQVIPWAEINRICAEEYDNAHGGRPAWAPAQMVAVLILMFLYGVSYESRTLAWVGENIIWCWFCYASPAACGLSFFGNWPNRNALYDFRVRVGAACFEQILTLAVEACVQSGLVSNLLASFDLTSVVASGHRWSPYERAVILTKALIRYLELCRAEQQLDEPMPDVLRKLAAEVALEVLPHKALDRVQAERVVESVEQWESQTEPQEPPWQEEVEHAIEAVYATGKRDLSPEGIRSTLSRAANKLLKLLPHTRGDLDARVGRTTDYTWFCGYLLGFMVDSAHHVITAVVLARGNAKQSRLFQPAMEAHRERVGFPEAVALDSAFDAKTDVHDYVDKHGIEGHVTSRDHASPANGGYGTDRLEWDEDFWILHCPNQTPLQAVGKAQKGRQTYVGTVCHTCSRYEKCYPKGQGEPKQFTLEPSTHRRWQENRKHCQTEEYKAARDQRFVEEGRFGLAKMNHHGAKAPYRSQDMNLIAGLMIATVMNYRVLARHQSSAAEYVYLPLGDLPCAVLLDRFPVHGHPQRGLAQRRTGRSGEQSECKKERSATS